MLECARRGVGRTYIPTPVLQSQRCTHMHQALRIPEKPEGHMSNVYRHAGMHKPQTIKIGQEKKQEIQYPTTHKSRRETRDLHNTYIAHICRHMQQTSRHTHLLIRLGTVSYCLPAAQHPPEPTGQMNMRSLVEIACRHQSSQGHSGTGISTQEDPRVRSNRPTYVGAYAVQA